MKRKPGVSNVVLSLEIVCKQSFAVTKSGRRIKFDGSDRLNSIKKKYPSSFVVDCELV